MVAMGGEDLGGGTWFFERRNIQREGESAFLDGGTIVEIEEGLKWIKEEKGSNVQHLPAEEFWEILVDGAEKRKGKNAGR